MSEALVTALVALIDSRIAAVGGTAAPAADPFGMGGTTAPAAEVVTPEMIQTLIMPLVANESMKQKLTAEMQAMGIAALPEAKPEQLAELYKRFQNVAASGGTAASTGGATSII